MTNDPIGPLELADLTYFNNWGCRQIADSSPTGVAVVTFSAIPQTYSHLLLVWRARTGIAALNEEVGLRIATGGGAVLTAGNYHDQLLQGIAATGSAAERLLGTQVHLGYAAGGTAPAGDCGSGMCLFGNYTAANFQSWVNLSQLWYGTTTGLGRAFAMGGTYQASAGALTSVQVLTTSNFATGSRFSLYGLT